MFKRIDLKTDKFKLPVIFIAAVEIGLLCYYNLFHIRDIVDSDFAMQMRHAIELSVNHTLFPRGWQYLTMGHFDDANLMAAFFYAFTRNGYISFGLSGIFNMALWAVVLFKLFKDIRIRLPYYFLALTLLFATYNFGMLEYTNMMFFGGGFYVYIPLVPVLLVTLLEFKGGCRKPSFYILAALCFILIFLTAAARGLYVFVCGILPILLCIAVCFISGINKERHRCWGLISILSVAATFAGIIINMQMNVAVKSYDLVKAKDYLASIATTIADYLRIFRALEEGPLSSLEVIASLARFGVVLFVTFFAVFFGGARRLFCLEAYSRFSKYKEGEAPASIEDGEFAQGALLSVFAFTFFVLTLTNTEPRYLLIAVVPVMIAAVIGFSSFELRDGRTLLPSLILAGVMVMLGINTVFSFIYTKNEYFHMEDGEYKRMDDILKLMEEYDAGTAFVDISQAERLRNYDLTRIYQTYDVESGEVKNREFYVYERDTSAFSDRNIIVTTEELFEEYPGYIRDNYEKIGQVSIYGEFEQGVWFSKTNPIDGISGFNMLDHAVDLPCAPGYRYEGRIDGSGRLTTLSTGNALISPELYSDGKSTYRMTLNYSMKDMSGAYLDFYLNDSLISSTPLLNINDSVTVDIPAYKGEYAFAVRKDDNKEISIDRIEFERL